MTLDEIQNFLIDSLKEHQPTLKITVDKPTQFKMTGTIPAMQGKKKVDGFYFGSIVPKPKDVRFYFFPMYTHRGELFEAQSEELKKCLKGKSCYHIKKLSPEMKTEITEMIQKAITLYQQDGLLAKNT